MRNRRREKPDEAAVQIAPGSMDSGASYGFAVVDRSAGGCLHRIRAADATSECSCTCTPRLQYATQPVSNART